jgi:hypothetical protein
MVDKKKLKPEEEPKEKLYRLTVTEEWKASSIDEARKMARKAVILWGVDGKDRIEDKVQRVIRKKYASRAERLDEAKIKISDARNIVEELKGEIEEWRDNLPENLQGGEKYSALDECASNLESTESSLEEADSNVESVEFPGMFD